MDFVVLYVLVFTPFLGIDIYFRNIGLRIGLYNTLLVHWRMLTMLLVIRCTIR